MKIGQILYNVQHYNYNSCTLISTNKNNHNEIITSDDKDYLSNKVSIYEDDDNLVAFFNATRFIKLGIQAPPKTQFIADSTKLITVGQSGIYELDSNIAITSLRFVKPSIGADLYNIYIDFVYEEANES